MCGIAGIGCSSDPAGTTLRILHAMAHRGTGAPALLCRGDSALGCVRLPLRDPHPRSDQPQISRDGRLAIVFNGEIYNVSELVDVLAAAGRHVDECNDTRVILELYALLGVGAFGRLRGMFALALVEMSNDGRDVVRMLLARDQFGIKPLYFAENGSRLCFASECKALVKGGSVPADLDRRGVASYLELGFVCGPGTIFSAVNEVPPGCALSWSGGRLEHERFARLSVGEEVKCGFDARARQLRAALQESVRLHCVGQDAVGVFLSSGVDSSVIASLASHCSTRVTTFTLRLPDHPTVDESGWAAQFSRSIGADHCCVELAAADLAGVLPAAVGCLDQPSMDGLNTWLVAREVGRSHRVVLSGIGMDEMMAGYELSARMLRVGRETSAEGTIRMRETMTALWEHAKLVFTYAELGELGHAPALSLDDCAGHFGLALFECTKPIQFERSLALVTRLGNQLLRDCDRVTMDHTIETRFPFVDREVLALLTGCDEASIRDADYKVSGSYSETGTKRLLRSACSDLLPADTDHRSKAGFWLPHEAWLRGPLRTLAEDLAGNGRLREHRIVPADFMPKLAATIRSGGAWYPRMWNLLALEMWLGSL